MPRESYYATRAADAFRKFALLDLWAEVVGDESANNPQGPIEWPEGDNALPIEPVFQLICCGGPLDGDVVANTHPVPEAFVVSRPLSSRLGREWEELMELRAYCSHMNIAPTITVSYLHYHVYRQDDATGMTYEYLGWWRG